jgi:formiminotetrahydrofolate cyclodeaminase
MEKLIELELSEFLDELAANSPAPGGGSVAALSGALGAALASMVCTLTIGKEQYEDVEDTIKQLHKKSETIRKTLTQLIDTDTEAFNEVMKAFKLPKNTEQQKEERKQIIQQAYKTAANVPLETARICLKVLDIADKIADIGNQNSITDAAIAAIMAHAGVQAAVLNVKINLGSIKDPSFVESAKKEIKSLKKKAKDKTTEILEKISQKLS